MWTIGLGLLKRLSPKVWGLVIALVAVLTLAAYAVGQHLKLVDVQFQKDSVEAANDTTKAFVHGHYTLFVKRSMQVALDRDSLNKKLKTIPRVRAAVTVAVAPIHDTVTVPIVVVSDSASGDSLLVVKFDDYKAPYKINAVVTADLVKQTADFDYSVTVDPFRMNVRLDCGASVNGVRPAMIGFDVPAFITVAIDTVKQSREVCTTSPMSLHIGMGSTVKKAAAVAVVGGVLGAVAYRLFHKGK